MNAADIRKSKRLQRVHRALSDGQPHSTMDLIRETGHVAINSVVSELRANGAEITCRRRREHFVYQMTEPATRQPRLFG